MSQYLAPSYQVRKFSCPRCGAIAQQDWKGLAYWDGSSWGSQPAMIDIFDMSDTHIERNEDSEPYEVGKRWMASRCGACEDHSLWIDEDLVFPTSADTVIPDVPAPAEDMPDGVRVLYLEAAAVYPYSRRAAAALCRAALERLTKFLTSDLPAKVSLDGRLASLSKNTDPVTYKVLSVIRHVGNTALHGEEDGDESAVIYLGDDRGQDIPDLFFAAMNELVVEKISRPRRIDSLYSALPEGVRANIERKMVEAQALAQPDENNQG